MGRHAVGDGVSSHGNGPRRDNPGAGEEDNLCLDRVERKATFRSPRDQPIHSALNTGDQQRRIGAPTEHRAVIRKCDPESVLIVDEADRLVETQGPEGRRANAP